MNKKSNGRQIKRQSIGLVIYYTSQKNASFWIKFFDKEER